MSDEVVFRVSDGEPGKLEPVGLRDLGYRERGHLQEWVRRYPEIVGPDLLLITSEFDRWQFGEERVRDRLDLLFLTSDGAPLVAELKRGEAPDTVDLQALKYAAYCSQLTVEQVIEAYADHHGVSREEAQADLFEHASSLTENELGPVRVRLMAEDFRPSVTTTVMWMHQELGLDIGCTRITARRLPDGSAVVTSRPIVPPPAEEYLVGVRRREREEERLQRASATRRNPNAVPRLLAAGAIKPDTKLSLKLGAFTRKDRQLVEQLLEADGSVGSAVWTGQAPATTALRWDNDGKEYSATRLVLKILQRCGARSESDPGGVPGPLFWEAPNGRTLSEIAESLASGEANDASEEGGGPGPAGGTDER